MLRKTLSAIVATIVLALPLAAQNLVVDGGFEYPVITGWDADTYYNYRVQNTTYAGEWLVNGTDTRDGYGGMFWIMKKNTPDWGPFPNPEGNQFGFLYSYSETSWPIVQQTLVTQPGKKYRLRFAMDGWRYSTGEAARVRVTLGDLDETFTAVPADGANHWQYFTRLVTASGYDELKFERVFSTVLLDDVSVVEATDNLVLDGGFESPVVTTGDMIPVYNYRVQDAVYAGDWLLNGTDTSDGYGGMMYFMKKVTYNWGAFNNPEGSQFGILVSYGEASWPILQQAIPTEAGKPYKLRFALDSWKWTSGGAAQVRVQCGSLDETFTANPPSEFGGWQYFERTITASGNDTLKLIRVYDNPCLDDISIVDASPRAEQPTFSPADGTIQYPVFVTISSATPNATIRYTTNGSIPDETSPVYTAPILVDHTMTISAKAWATNLQTSFASSATYTLSESRPQSIPYINSVTIDGNLSEWADAEWADLNKQYWTSAGDWLGNDISNAKYAMKWGANGTKVYLALKVPDGQHVFSTGYGNGTSSDRVEMQIHTSSTNSTDYHTPGDLLAQQYTIGLIAGTENSPTPGMWSGVKGDVPVPANAGFQCAGKLSGSEIRYEVAMTPFEYFGALIGQTNTTDTLVEGDIIGVDAVVGSATTNGWFFMMSQNMMTGKYCQTGSIARHLLLKSSSITDTKKKTDGSVVLTSGIVSRAFDSYFYLESTDRSTGIRVSKSNHGLSAGDSVTVDGIITTIDGAEKCVLASGMGSAVNVGALAPLGMNNKSVGGGNSEGQSGMAGKTGLNNIGLLVKVWGKVTSLGSGRYSLDDGSGTPLTVQVLSGSINGTYVAVTGVISCEKISNQIQPLLLVKDASTDVNAF